ncbi:MAG: flavin reductase family protein [Phycisphaerales bacterium]|jgi:flavin reductase (DIM6/NTAB) family NADH-FMN oxidoreductase RutF
MEFTPAELHAADRYKLLIGMIVPRPIAFVSTISPEGKTNLAPFSFFCGVGSEPMTLAFCPAADERGEDKDTLKNCLPEADGGTGAFVVNVVTEAIARQMAACAEQLPYGDSEFDLSGLTPVASSVVKPPRVAQCPAAFECVTRQVVRTNPGVPSSGNLVLGEVVRVHAAEGLVNDRHHTDPAKLAAFGRMGGKGYCTTRDRFDLPWGKAALE